MKEKFAIITQLAKMENEEPVLIDGQPVYETNYFCGFRPVPNPTFSHIQLIEWDTDVSFAKTFNSRYEAKQIVCIIESAEVQIVKL